ncbi:ferritin-like domain-containing protein [Denitromonas iodatirespirans]|uniref:Ferritin-like domain-containing protein n=1 Tax=Denitromonas iodatirespirans TaxID=2795389 RepID=A0A944H796_DENI1|nr:ferritin-like domain-containing protein [Denitromonas iodatirespirans]MBT0960998.1 ferritin-like domain-containing protein [Denitromonas iodatirespirans]
MDTTLIDLSPTRLERRRLLAAGGLFALGATAAIGLAAPGRALAGKATMTDADDLAILNVALGLEYQAIAAYQVGAESGLLTKPVLDVALKFQGHHKAHAEVLAGTVGKLGGTPAMAMRTEDYRFPVDTLKDQADVLRFAAGLEQGAASAYLGAVPQFSNRALARAAASILGDETMHWAILLNVLGEDPVPAAFIG